MRRFHLLAGVLAACALIAGPASAASLVEAMKVWPKSGEWRTAATPSAADQLMCVSSAEGVQASGVHFTISVLLTAFGTHVHILHDPRGPVASPPRTVDARVDGQPLASWKVIKPWARVNGLDILVADVPGSDLVDKILPRLTKGRRLQVSAGGEAYEVSLANYPEAAQQLADCALYVRGVLSDPPDTPAASRVQPIDPANVKSAVQMFVSRQQQAGMQGAVEVSEEGYRYGAAKNDWDSADFCIAFDGAASAYDRAVAKEMHFPTEPYFEQAKLDTRASAIVAGLGGDKETKELHIDAVRTMAVDMLTQVLEAENKKNAAAEARRK